MLLMGDPAQEVRPQHTAAISLLLFYVPPGVSRLASPVGSQEVVSHPHEWLVLIGQQSR